MPDDGEFLGNEITFKNALKKPAQNVRLDTFFRLPIRKIAIVAVEIAERRGLDDQQVEFLGRAIAWILHENVPESGQAGCRIPLSLED